MNNHIISATCQACNICVLACPNKIIGTDEAGKAKILNERAHLCISCGQCMAVCKTAAVNVEGLSFDSDMEHLNGEQIYPETIRKFLLSRRSVRNFRDRKVPRELLERIIEMISYAPYGAIPDGVHITVIEDRARIARGLPLMSEFYRKLERWLGNPLMRMIIKKRAGMEQYNTMINHLLDRIKIGHYDTSGKDDNITRNAPAIILFHGMPGTEMLTTDAVIYSTYAALAAHSLGLGATINSLVPAACNKSSELKKIFGIPELHVTVESVLVGYPKFRYIYGIKHAKRKVNWL